jgi:hypothetical protein
MQSTRRIAVVLSGAALLSAVLASLAFKPDREAAVGLSDDRLDRTFDDDMRRVVYRWDPNDPRPAALRRRALFDFIYQTYDSSAWVPQSLFETNVVTQAVVGDVDTIVRDRVGLVLWRDNAAVTAFGMAPNRSPHEPLKWTVNCLVCHTAEIDGITYFGAGTKVFDDRVLGDALKLLTSDRWRGLLPGDTGDRAAAATASRILTSHHHDKIDSLTRGRSTAFAASHVELYMRPHGGAMPGVDEVGRGDTKTPPLWHTAAKIQRGRWYSDGSFHGTIPLMASSMELEKDRSFDALVHTVIPTIKQEFDSVVRHLRPPAYPYAIDAALAEKGRTLFYAKAIGCARCHGVYDGKGNVDWPGVHADVGSDPARRDLVSDAFIAAFDDSPLAAEGSLERSRGYAATPLTGVWANYPYLHNGSVPTLYHLLGPVNERPKIFQVTAARTLDRDRVGQPLVASRLFHGWLGERELLRRFGDDRDWFNTARPGCSNAGHDVWWRIRTDENRRALIEYLKTL